MADAIVQQCRKEAFALTEETPHEADLSTARQSVTHARLLHPKGARGEEAGRAALLAAR